MKKQNIRVPAETVSAFRPHRKFDLFWQTALGLKFQAEGAMVRQISIAAGVLAFLVGIAVAQGPADEGAAARKAFKACESAEWQGSVEVPFDESKSQDNSNSTSVRLDCQAYLRWWDGQVSASPFTVLNDRHQINREIPPEKWMKYLQFLPVLSAKTKPNG
jgi:hypothetical protein